MRRVLLLIVAALVGVLVAFGARKVFPPPEPVVAAAEPVAASDTPTSSRVEIAPAPTFKTLPAQPVDTTTEKPLNVAGVAWMTERVPIFNRSGQMVREIVTPRGLRVILSDGRVITEADDVIESVDTRGVKFKDGSRLWMAPARRAAVGPPGILVAPAKPPAEAATAPETPAAQ